MHLLTEQCSSILLIIVGCSIKHNDVTEVNDVNTQSLQLEVAIKIEHQSQLPANNHPLIARFTEQWFVTQRSSWRPTWACFVAGTTGWTGGRQRLRTSIKQLSNLSADKRPVAIECYLKSCLSASLAFNNLCYQICKILRQTDGQLRTF